MTATVLEVPVGIALTNKDLISDQLWQRLVNRIVKDEDMELSLAERIMDQALAFLRLCAREPNGRYSPSELVDVGWHTFILYTREYAAFCEMLTAPRWVKWLKRFWLGRKMVSLLQRFGFGSRFIHHSPFDEDGVDYGTGHVDRTVAALKRHGIAVDEALWTCLGAKCDHGDGACTNRCGKCS